MCGIAGIISHHSSSERENRMQRMLQKLVHRGPDDFGIVSFGNVTFGHRRLSIIDVSSQGRQPLANEDESLWLVANGEIYNFQEIESRFLRQTHHFRSRTDTEMIIHLYEEYGDSFLSKLRGMFAFGLYDLPRKKLMLVRDRLGIKPLYYAEFEGGLVFASELVSVLASGLVPVDIDPESLDLYLAYGYVPQPHTLIKSVRQLPAGSILSFELSKKTISRKYWNVPHSVQTDFNRDQILSDVRGILDESIKLHTISDVPLGAFLSGGIDSSLVVGMMAKQSSLPIKTFSIGFTDGPERLNEWNFARQVAVLNKTEHREILITGQEVAADLDRMIMAMDQPSFDGINTYLVSQAAKRGGLTVALSGLGGDEIFGGYDLFRVLPRFSRLIGTWGVLPDAMKSIVKAFAGSGFIPQRLSRRLHRMAQVRDLVDFYAAARLAFSLDERRIFYRPPTLQEREDPAVEILRSCVAGETHPWRIVTLLEMNAYMIWRLLRDTDVMSMAHALEVRVPLIDHKLVEYILSLPRGWESVWGHPKKLLVEVGKEYLPSEITDRPKQGFQFPMEVWMKRELKEIVLDALGPQGLEGRGWFEKIALQKLWKNFLQERVDYTLIWQFVVLELWARKTLDRVYDA